MVDTIAPLSVTIPAPDTSAGFIARSAKGEIRTDAAAPPTVAANGEGSFSFADLIDAINPLQHIPVISTAYRAITGEKISMASNVAGGALYGGPIGGIFAVASSLFSELFEASRDSAAPAATQVADSSRAATPDIMKA